MGPVVIPWRGGDPHRERALKWVLGKYEGRLEARVAEFRGEPWCKATPVLEALRTAPSDSVAIADADVFCEEIESAFRAVTCGAAGWAIPHRKVYRLTEQGTAAVIRGEPWEKQRLEREPYPGVFGGGIVVAHRDTLLEVPLDRRFLGWGGEDKAFGVALTTLVGKPWRGTAPLVHLYHPHKPREHRMFGSLANKALHRRYIQARRSPEAMKALLEESCR